MKIENCQKQIDDIVKSHDVVLFMKGTRAQPSCGFSSKVVDLLDQYLEHYHTVDVLADEKVRKHIKAYSSWPTLPQIFVKGKFQGGCDIIVELEENGELASVLGSQKRKIVFPEVEFSERAANELRVHLENVKHQAIRLEIDSNFHTDLSVESPHPRDLISESGGLRLCMPIRTAERAQGLFIDYIESSNGISGFKIENPNEPPKVKMLQPEALKQWIDSGKPMGVFDVRTAEERQIVCLENTILLDEKGKELLETLDRKTPLVLYCHHGVRSVQAAQHCIRMGFSEVYSLVGGIDAWSKKIDPSLPTY